MQDASPRGRGGGLFSRKFGANRGTGGAMRHGKRGGSGGGDAMEGGADTSYSLRTANARKGAFPYPQRGAAGATGTRGTHHSPRGGKPERGRGGRGKGTKDDFGMSLDSGFSSGFRLSIAGAEDMDPTEVAKFLLTKCSVQFTYTECSMDQQGLVHLSVPTKAESQAICALSGIRIGPRKLIIKFDRKQKHEAGAADDGDMPMDGQQAPGRALSDYIDVRYNAQAKMLDLHALRSQPTLTSVRIDMNNKNFVRQLFDMIAKRCADVVSINFAQNSISTLAGFQQLAVKLPSCENLCLDSNHLADLHELEHLKSAKLRELMFTNNPIVSVPDYANAVPRAIPSLQVLDGQKVKPPISFGFPVQQERSVPASQPPYFDSEHNKQLAYTFVKRFLQYYDNARDRLVNVYDERSAFSLNVSPLGPEAVKKPQQQQRGPQQHRDHIGTYLTSSRNLLRCTDNDKRAELIHRGAIGILSTLIKLPKTRHQDDVVIEASMVPTISQLQLLQITIHGHFIDTDNETTRSFDRTLLLTPAAPDSNTARDGWQAVILNDMFHVRNYSPNSAQFQSASPVIPTQHTMMIQQPVANLGVQYSPTAPTMNIGQVAPIPLGAPMGTTAVQQSPYAGLTIEQQQKAMHISQQTRLNVTYAVRLLVTNLWDVNAAMSGFALMQQQKSIPAEAWQQ